MSAVRSSSFRRMSVAVVSAVLIGSVLSASPSLADEEATWGGPEATSELNEVELPSPGGNKNTSTGDGSALSDALDEALATDEPVEVEALQTSTETVVANPDGTVTTEMAQAPVRVEQDGDWVDIDPSLEKAGDRVAPVATPGDVSFSGDGEGSLARVELGGEVVSFGLPGLDLGAPLIDGAVATYDIAESSTSDAPEPSPSPSENPTPAPASTESDDATPSKSVQVAVKSRGFAAHVILDEAPAVAPEYVFELKTGALVPTLEDGVLTLSDADGKAVAQSLPLRMWDAQVDVAGDPTNVADVEATLQRAGAVWELTLSPSMEFLTAADTQYPVTVDPDLIEPEGRGDSMFRSGADANVFFGNEPRIDVGWDDGMKNYGFFGFAYNNYLGATVTKAELGLYQYYAPTCTARQVNVYSMTSGDGSQRRWSNMPTHLDNDARFASSKSFNKGAAGCGRGKEMINVTAIVSGWAGGQIGTHTLPQPQVFNSRQAFIVRAENETSGGGYKRFCSENWSSNLVSCNNAGVVPTLSVTVEPEIGEQGWYSMTERQLDERTTLKVNNKNANLFIASQDLNVKGVGMDLTLNRTYNSQSLETGPMGPGWSLDVGPDVWLEKRSQYRYNLHAPGGTVLGSFVRKRADHSTTAEKEQYDTFIAPLGGVGAELKDTNEGFVLTYRKSQQKFAFNRLNSDGDAFMTAVKDRSDNTIQVDYHPEMAGSKPKIKEIVDTVGRKLLPTYTGNVITKWATEDVGDVTARQWLYTYSGGNLASASDALGAVTNYTYKTDPNRPDLLTSIAAPANQSGTRPTTEIGYGNVDISSPSTTSRRVGSVDYRHGNGQNDFYRYSWELIENQEPLPEICDDDANFATKVKDPRGNTTTYCYTRRAATAGDSKTWVYDAREKARSQDYNADNQPLNSTAPTGQGTTGSSSSAEYNTKINDQMTSFTAAKSDGASDGDRTSMVYGEAASKPGGNYLPDVVSDGADDCNRYMYDDAGRTATTFSGLNPSMSGGKVTGCDTSPSSKRSERRYNDNGTLKESWDANNDDDMDDSQKTVYTYWASGGDTPEGAQGQVKTIRKPGGDCSTGPSRRLCASFTYDGAARVKTMIDGRGQKTRYFYDANDRITVTHFNDDQSQICPAAGLSCIGYEYDAVGNLVKRDDQGGRTDYTYDRLNRQLTQKQPAGALGHDNLAYVYDPANNLVGYSQTLNLQPADVTTYTYNVANQPIKVTSAVGEFVLGVDDDGRTSGVTFPNPNNSIGAKLKYTYTRSGKPKDFTWTNGSDSQLAKWDYNYKVGTKDTPQLQERILEVVGNDPREGETEYEYNDDQRLESAKRTNSTDPYNYEYTYDKVGNILSEKIGSTTTHHGYNRAGERCWTGPNSGSATQMLSTPCVAGPSGATNFNHDAAGNNTGTASDPVNYNEKSQVSRIGNTDQTYWGPGNDTRYTRGTERQISGQMGMTATSGDIGILYYTRSPDGTVLAVRSGSSSAFYVTEPNGHVAYMTDVNGATIGAYEYSPYGKTTVIGNVAFNPIRYLGAYQEPVNSNGDQIYKLGARFYGTSGAFTQPDALSGGLGDPRTMTAYNYAGGDPINNADPSGYFLEDAFNSAVDGFVDFYESTAGTLVWGYGASCYSGAGAGGFFGAVLGTYTFPIVGTAAGGTIGATFGCLAGVITYGVSGEGFPEVPIIK